MKFEDWKYHSSKLPEGFAQKEIYTKKLERIFIREIKKSPEAKKYFEPYKPEYVEIFIQRYAVSKANIVNGSDYYYNEIHKSPELRYRGLTEDCLNLILQKKLFNQQLLWRAEKVTFPEIRIFWDFRYWHHNIRNCPFIEPITPHDIEIMKDFLRTEYCEIAGNVGDYQSFFYFEDIMIQDEDGDFDCMPDFFEFYDNRMGTGALLSLPDIRCEKEDHYHSLSAKKRNKERNEELVKNPPTTPAPELEYLSSGYEEMTRFAEQFEDPIFIMFFQYLRGDINSKKESKNEERDVSDIYDELMEIPNPPPVRSGLNWRDALYYCYLDYVHSVVAEEIDIAYKEYLLYKELGLSYEEDECALQSQSTCNMVYEMILEGRELSGEPRDLNF